eukprot:CAMPEP_0175942544 /NCGR_PEP_ID=MMETSP0108-20121206/25007_1 /TAXON_ID=195067 ORGANISM="Goniomonas pacifica, Strain CCMP1869" /NCGR_SAMPLE_ID=MMETSP0108 /ASSEMBLY_ACC=CAM_ASM_000204 /LENGTH=38 /DNA_ID= /DNA_START= /DNA_END= /DNA_ORIENTATION=
MSQLQQQLEAWGDSGGLSVTLRRTSQDVQREEPAKKSG